MPIEREITLSILMPCLNEARTLGTCISKAQAYLARQNFLGEIIVADNGSTDGSIEIAESLGASVVTVLQRGYGNALSGLRLSSRPAPCMFAVPRAARRQRIHSWVELGIVKGQPFTPNAKDRTLLDQAARAATRIAHRNRRHHYQLSRWMLPSRRFGAVGRANMIISQTPNSAEERKRVARLEVARRLYQALVAQDPDRLITLRDGGGRVVARHDPRPEQGDPEIAS
jgi:glycosyltransferase involved in cell wall biosynthesis